ncbi:MAG: hypothetical protein C4B55_05335 [Candidatus Methanophagaceae archaeon]|nr:MAG: hypothetical protein C4B55_05335 [Methanophagales archaeon]
MGQKERRMGQKEREKNLLRNSDIVFFDNLKALKTFKDAEKKTLFFTLDKNLCEKARAKGFICRAPDDYLGSKDLETTNSDFDLMRKWLSKLAAYDGFNLGSLVPDLFINLEAMQKFRVFKILREVIDQEKPKSVKVAAKGKQIYRWSEVGDREIPASLAEAIAKDRGIVFKSENICLTTRIKNRLFRSTAPFLLRSIEKIVESGIRIKHGKISKNASANANTEANAKILIFLHSNKNWQVIEPVLKRLGKEGEGKEGEGKEREGGKGIELLIIYQSHGFFNFGLSRRDYEHLQDLGAVRSFESYQTKTIYKIATEERKRLKKLWDEILNDDEFQKNFRLGNVAVWKAFEDCFWLYYAVQFPRLVKYIETGKRILEIEEPEVVLFLGDGPLPSRTFSTVAEKFQVPTVLISHGIYFPTKRYIPNSKYVAVWGPKLGEYMILTGLSKEQITATGAPNYDALAKLGSKEELRRELGLPENKPLVTFATQGFSDQIRRKLIFEVLKSMKKLDEVLLVIKPHPREKPKLYRNLLKEFNADISSDKIVLMPGVNTSKLVKASDLLLTVHSTVALESNVIGTPVVTLNFTAEKDLFYSQEGGAVGVENPETLTNTIYKALFDEEFREEMKINRDEFLRKFIACKDGGAAERAADLVLEVMKKSKK